MTLLTEQTPNFAFQFKVVCKVQTIPPFEIDTTGKMTTPKITLSKHSFTITANVADTSETLARWYLQTCFIVMNERKKDYGLGEHESFVIEHIGLVGSPIPVLISYTNPRTPQGKHSLGVSLAKVPQV